MKSVPKFMQGAYRTRMRQALDAVSLGEERGDDLLQIRGWKLFFFASPDVSLPLQSGRPGSEEDIVSQSGPLPNGSVGPIGRDEPHQFHMVQLGEVSAGRQALDGACLAPGDLKTQKALENPTRRPPVPRDLLPDSSSSMWTVDRIAET